MAVQLQKVKTISVTDLRRKTRAIVREVAKSDEPLYVLVHSAMPIYLMSAKHDRGQRKNRRPLSAYAGMLKGSKAFAEGGVAYQRKLRDDWE